MFLLNQREKNKAFCCKFKHGCHIHHFSKSPDFLEIKLIQNFRSTNGFWPQRTAFLTFHSFVETDKFPTNFPSSLRKNIVEISDIDYFLQPSMESGVLNYFIFSLIFLENVNFL